MALPTLTPDSGFTIGTAAIAVTSGSLTGNFPAGDVTVEAAYSGAAAAFTGNVVYTGAGANASITASSPSTWTGTGANGNSTSWSVTLTAASGFEYSGGAATINVTGTATNPNTNGADLSIDVSAGTGYETPTSAASGTISFSATNSSGCDALAVGQSCRFTITTTGGNNYIQTDTVFNPGDSFSGIFAPTSGGEGCFSEEDGAFFYAVDAPGVVSGTILSNRAAFPTC